MPLSNILDPVHDTLDPTVFDSPADPSPIFKQQHQGWIEDRVHEVLEGAGYTHVDNWLSLVLTGSLTTYQYSPESDTDISLFVDTEVFPDWSRAEIIGLMVSHIDGSVLPGTTHPMQCFVVPPEIKKTDLYQPGLRSGWDFRSRSWVVPPDRTRVHDVQKEMNSAYVMGLEAADKMEHLLRYEPDKAVQYWHQIHKRRQRDQRAGKGDYSDSNIVYKFLANRGLFPEISEASGEYIAKTAGLLPYDGPRRYVVDKAAVRRAAKDLGLSKPVEVTQVGGTHGTVVDQPDRYLICVVGWLRSESASRQIWHELKHAQQIDQGQTEFLNTNDIPYQEYSQLPYELDARTYAEQASEYALTYDVRTASVTWQPGEHPGKAVILDGQVHVWPVDEEGSPHHTEYLESVGIDPWGGEDGNQINEDVMDHIPQLEIDPDGTVYDMLDGQHEHAVRVADAIGGKPADMNKWFLGRVAAWPVVRKFVYDVLTDQLIVGEEGPEEGVNLSHNQLCQQLGIGGLDELNGIAGTISKTGWVTFEYQHEQKGQPTAKTRYQAEQALKRQVPDIQGFLGGETSDTIKQLWQFSSLPEATPEPAGTI